MAAATWVLKPGVLFFHWDREAGMEGRQPVTPEATNQKNRAIVSLFEKDSQKWLGIVRIHCRALTFEGTGWGPSVTAD